MARTRAGFTLIEILAVVVIMMILAAILLPVLGRAGEQSRRTQCMTNLHQISIALKLYKLDQRGYPRDLSEYPLPTGGCCRWFGSKDATTLLPDKKVPGYGLAAVYPDYLESAKSFNCPDNGVDVLTDPGEPTGDVAASLTTGCATYDSYDGVDPLIPASQPERLRYRRYWRAASATPDPQYRRQLSWRYPPDDTVVTWCIYHRAMADLTKDGITAASDPVKQKGSYDIVLYLDGTTKVMPSLAGSGHASMPGDG